MDIFISINNREQVIQLPIVPSEFSLPSTVKNETFETVNQGELKLIGFRGIQTVTFESFFPSKEYSFARDNSYKGWEYVEIINSWIDRRVPIRLIITDTPVNMPVVIDKFEYGPRDGTGDIYYSLTLSEFKFLRFGKRYT